MLFKLFSQKIKNCDNKNRVLEPLPELDTCSRTIPFLSIYIDTHSVLTYITYITYIYMFVPLIFTVSQMVQKMYLLHSIPHTK